MSATPEFQVIDPSQLASVEGTASPSCWHEGAVSARRAEPAGFGQFVAYLDLHAGSRIGWRPPHGEEAIVVLDGEIDVDAGGDGRTLGPAGAAVFEYGASGALRALVATRLLHVGAISSGPNLDSMLGAPAGKPCHVHTFDEDGAAKFAHERDGHRDHTVWYTDSYCNSCRLSLFRVFGDASIARPMSHSHTAHELITVVDGELRFGPVVAPTLTTVAIPAGRKYGFTTRHGGWAFVNFRLDASYIDFGRGRPRVLESINSFAEHAVRV